MRDLQKKKVGSYLLKRSLVVEIAQMVQMSFAVDEEVDVLDPIDDIWSPARIKTGN